MHTAVVSTHEDTHEDPTNKFNLADSAAAWQMHGWLNNAEQLLVSGAILSRALESVHTLATEPPPTISLPLSRAAIEWNGLTALIC